MSDEALSGFSALTNLVHLVEAFFPLISLTVSDNICARGYAVVLL